MQEYTYTDNRYMTHNSEYINYIEDIEDEVYYDLNNICTDFLFKRDCFKKNGHSIDIVSPGEVIPGSKSVLEDPDAIRFMLSLYPYESDLEKIQTIVLQPRHIEINGIELAGLYIAGDKLLVLYMHSPFLYQSDDIKFSENSKILSYALSNYSYDNSNINNNSSGKSGIPPLWYVLSTVILSTEKRIEKFFIRAGNTKSSNSLHRLSDISFLYSRLGY